MFKTLSTVFFYWNILSHKFINAHTNNNHLKQSKIFKSTNCNFKDCSYREELQTISAGVATFKRNRPGI